MRARASDVCTGRERARGGTRWNGGERSARQVQLGQTDTATAERESSSAPVYSVRRHELAQSACLPEASQVRGGKERRGHRRSSLRAALVPSRAVRGPDRLSGSHLLAVRSSDSSHCCCAALDFACCLLMGPSLTRQRARPLSPLRPFHRQAMFPLPQLSPA